MNQLLVVDPVKPSGKKAAAKGHFQPISLFGRGGGRLIAQGAVDRLAVDGCNRSEVVRRLQPALDLKRAEAQPDEFRDFVDGREILRG